MRSRERERRMGGVGGGGLFFYEKDKKRQCGQKKEGRREEGVSGRYECGGMWDGGVGWFFWEFVGVLWERVCGGVRGR